MANRYIMLMRIFCFLSKVKVCLEVIVKNVSNTEMMKIFKY